MTNRIKRSRYRIKKYFDPLYCVKPNLNFEKYYWRDQVVQGEQKEKLNIKQKRSLYYVLYSFKTIVSHISTGTQTIESTNKMNADFFENNI